MLAGQVLARQVLAGRGWQAGAVKKQMFSTFFSERDGDKGRKDRRRSVNNDDKRKNADEGYDSDDGSRKRKSKKTGSANTETSGVGTDDDVESRKSIEFIDYDGQVPIT